MGLCASTLESHPEFVRGPIRTRFSLDDAPDDIPRSLNVTHTKSEVSTNYVLPLIGYTSIVDRKVPMLHLLRFDNTKLLTELFEYLPQYPMRTRDLKYTISHPNGTVLHMIEYTEHKQSPFGVLWKKECFGKTWTEVGTRTASYTYDPLLRDVLKRVCVQNIRIYDSHAIIPVSVYVKIEDTDGNIHTISPSYKNDRSETDHVYLITLKLEETMYMDEMEERVNSIYRSLNRNDVTIKKERGGTVLVEKDEEVVDLTQDIQGGTEVEGKEGSGEDEEVIEEIVNEIQSSEHIQDEVEVEGKEGSGEDEEVVEEIVNEIQSSEHIQDEVEVEGKEGSGEDDDAVEEIVNEIQSSEHIQGGDEVEGNEGDGEGEGMEDDGDEEIVNEIPSREQEEVGGTDRDRGNEDRDVETVRVSELLNIFEPRDYN
jgi:hypothetical protein